MPGRPCRMSSARSARAVGLISLMHGDGATGSGRGASGMLLSVDPRHRPTRMKGEHHGHRAHRRTLARRIGVGRRASRSSSGSATAPRPSRCPGRATAPPRRRTTTRWPRCSPRSTPPTGRPFVVGHSAACTLAWVAADARPDEGRRRRADRRVARRRRRDLRRLLRARRRRGAVPGVGAVRGPRLRRHVRRAQGRASRPAPSPCRSASPRAPSTGPTTRRHDVPLTLICPEFSPAQAQEWIDGGDVPELAEATQRSSSSTSTPATGRCSPSRPRWRR